MNYFYEAVDATGQSVVGKIEGLDETEVRRKLQQLGYDPRSVAPAMPVEATTMGAATATLADPEWTSIGVVKPPARTIDGTLMYPQQQAIRPSETRTGSIVMSGNAARVAAQQKELRAVQTRAVPVTPQAPGVSDLGGVTTRDLMMFFRQFSSLLHSGISVFGALDNLAPRTPNAHLTRVAREMADAARAGGRISDVMLRYPRIFPDHISATVRAGETGGFLEIALAEIAHNYEQNIALYRGSWLPKLFATQAFFLIFIVQPLFGTIFSSFDIAANVGLYFKILLFRNLPIAFALYFLIRYAARHFQLPKFRHWRDEMALKMPPFGDLQRQAAIAAFLRMLRRLFHAGVAPIQAWEGAMNTASNVVIRERLAASYELMQQGASLPDAFARTGLFTDQVEQLITTGHQSGQVVEMLDQATEYYQQQVDESASKSKFMMLRLGILAALILGGAAMLWMTYGYFHGMFDWVDKNFSE